MFNRIIEILSLPIMILNMVGGIIGGIWLAILGEWGLIGIGILLMFTSHWILAILMMPSLLFNGELNIDRLKRSVWLIPPAFSSE